MSMSDTREDWVEAAEARALEAAVRLAPTLGWGARMAEAAVREAGVDRREARLLLPDGPRDLAVLLWKRHDAQALAKLATVDASALKVRARIRAAVEARVEAAVADGEAERKAQAYMALPTNAPLALRLAWSTADALWRWAGDTSTDENHYSKRLLLAGIVLSTSLAWTTRGREAALRRLDAQIGQVMTFEGWKARLPAMSDGLRSLAGVLGRTRYGARDHG